MNGCLLILKLNLPDGVDFPSANEAGTALLARLLDFVLDELALKTEPCNHIGPLNHCLFMFRVFDAKEAAKAMLAELRATGLFSDHHITLLREDRSEGVLRYAFPARNADVVRWDVVRKELKSECKP